MEYDLCQLYNRAKTHGYEGPLDILCIFDWLMSLGYIGLPDSPKKWLGRSNEISWTINFYKDFQFAGFKGGSGSFKNALLNGIDWMLNEIEHNKSKQTN